jgi:type I restriction enzyme S subunit
LLVGIGATIGKSALVDRRCSSNQQVMALEFVSERVNSRYAAYSIGNLECVFRDRAQYTTMPIMNQTEIGAYQLAAPSLDEQTQIAKFLDYETARIDALIEKQQQLIALLQEKRQAVISHAVTKGLNPDAPMRDSGVEYFSRVASHWQIAKFGLISEVVRGGSPRPAGDPRYFDGDYSPWVTVSEVTKDADLFLSETETFLTQLGSAQCRIFEPDTLLLSNSGATLGVPKILKIQANANDGVLAISTSQR